MRSKSRMVKRALILFLVMWVMVFLLLKYPEKADFIFVVFKLGCLLVVLGFVIWIIAVIVKAFLPEDKNAIFDIEKDNGYEFFGGINKKRVKRIDICPKYRTQLYRVPKGVFLKIYEEVNGTFLEQVKVVKTYNKHKGTIKVVDYGRKKGPFKTKLTLKCEDVFDALGITYEMTDIEFFFDKFNGFVYDGVNVLPESNRYNLNDLLKYYNPFADDLDRMNSFVSAVKVGIEIVDEGEIESLYAFIDKKVNPLMLELCMCFVSMYEFNHSSEGVFVKREREKMFNYFKLKFPWMNDKAMEEYLKCVWNKKGARIECKKRYLEMRALEVYATHELGLEENIIRGWTDKELQVYIKDKVEEDCRYSEFDEFKKEYLKNKIKFFKKSCFRRY